MGEDEKEQPNWATPELDKLGTAVGEKLEKANEARDDLDVALGVAPSSSDGSGAEGDASGSASASGPAEAVAASSGPSGPSDAGNSTELTPFEVLKKRMAGIAKMAREMLGGPKKNATAPSGASGGAEEDEDADASGASGAESGASGPAMKSLTRTFVSDGATSTVTTVFNKKGDADSPGKVWSAVKKMEKEHGKMKANAEKDANAEKEAAAGASGGASPSGPGAAGKSGASGSAGKSGASGSETPVDKKLKALEEELYGKSGSSGASGSESGASGPEEDGSGSSGASGGAPINGITDGTILRLIASRMDGMGTPKGGSGASGSAEPQTPGDEQPFEDSKAIEKIAKQIGKVDKKDSKALMEIARKLATADSTTGLEK